MPYEAFDALPHALVSVPGGRLRVGFADGPLSLERTTLLSWIERSAAAVSGYYGRFPVDDARLLVVPASGRRVGHGQAFGHRGAAIRITLGSEADDDALARDWILVHEMVHLALPRLARRHDWLAEGLASYIEPIVRARAGSIPEEAVWAEFAREMPKGLPGRDDRGLDRTPTWARTYWGGALFCLLADLEIRRRTDNRVGLQHAMRGVLAAGGNHEGQWPIEAVLAAADAAIGVPVLSDLYRQHAEQPISPDLDALWQSLGVRIAGNGVVLDDSALLAHLRRAIAVSP